MIARVAEHKVLLVIVAPAALALDVIGLNDTDAPVHGILMMRCLWLLPPAASIEWGWMQALQAKPVLPYTRLLFTRCVFPECRS